MNVETPSSSRQVHPDDDGAHPNNYFAETPEAAASHGSPVVSQSHDTRDDSPYKENSSPSKPPRHSRIMSGNEIAPLRILCAARGSGEMVPPAEAPSPVLTQATPTKPTPSKGRRPLSLVNRFPIKVNTGSASPMRVSTGSMSSVTSTAASSATSPDPQSVESPDTPVAPVEKDISLEEALRANEGLKKAIQIFEDESTILEKDEDFDIDIDAAPPTDDHHPDRMDVDESAAPDESMVSAYSTFSAVPNMTMFARIGHSPTRFASSSPTRTPRAPGLRDSSNLMEFTDQISGLSSSNTHRHPSPSRGRPIPSRTPGGQPRNTPQREGNHLLDFDIPPLPTPRSVPTVSAREVETLKSAFLSEISSLKASLLGKEAEVSSLKTAIADAEKRVGASSEQFREEKSALTEEKEQWERRANEMETVLRRVKGEIQNGRDERQELESKLAESEMRREAAEMMAQEAESKMAGMRAGKASSGGNHEVKSPSGEGKNPGSRDVEIAVERVARELHGLYKTKHENKVAALKKSYESRWEKKVHALEMQIEELSEENEQLKLSRDAMTRVEPSQAAENEELRAKAAEAASQIRQLDMEIQRLEAVVTSVKQDNQELIQMLEKERVEKGELVQLAEEMMSMQHSMIQEEPAPAPAAPRTRPAAAHTAPTPHAARVPHPSHVPRAPASPVPARAGVTSPVPTRAGVTSPVPTRSVVSPVPQQNFRSSIGRPLSGLRAPVSLKKPTPVSESRIGGLSHQRTRSNGPGGGLPRPRPQSGIMSNIEKMGNYRGRME
jgi:hypothetical protein